MQSISESCPLCGTELSKIKFTEIQAKIRLQEQQHLAQQKKKVAEAESTVRHRMEEEFRQQLQVEKDAAAKLAKQDAEQQIKKIVSERDAATKKLKEAETREAAIRKQAEQEKEAAAKLAKQQAEAQVKKITAERDEANKKLKAAEAREAEVRKESEEAAQKKYQKELTDQRAALEKDKTMSLLKQQGEFNRERERLQKKVKLMEHQLERKTANELGDGGEIDVFESLREAFLGDRITRIKKGQPGADILHEVLYKGQPCGRIVIDSKNHQGWQNGFVTKLRQDQIVAGAEHAILATTAFPAGKKEMCVESDVIVVNPARIVYVSQILRQAMVTMHIRGLSIKERAGKMSRLYNLITSEAYSRKFSEAGKLTQEILELDVQEKKTHDNVWKKRGAFAMRINNVLRELETGVASVIEGDEEPPAMQDNGVQGVKMAATSVPLSEEATAWKKH